MPRERRSIVTGAVIEEMANWTDEEVIVWLDNEDKKQEEEDNRLQAEMDAIGNIYSTRRDIWARVEEEVNRDSELYIH